MSLQRVRRRGGRRGGGRGGGGKDDCQHVASESRLGLDSEAAFHPQREEIIRAVKMWMAGGGQAGWIPSQVMVGQRA